MIVVDANVVAVLVLRTSLAEQMAAADALLAQREPWVVPSLFRTELRNVLATQLRLSLLTVEEALDAFDAALALVRMVGDPPMPAIFDVVTAHGCSAYDAEYVALARTLRVPLATFDRRLRSACPDVARHPSDLAA